MNVYISLGTDCSVAYNLQKYNVRKNAYPFDWIRCSNFSKVVECIQNHFQDFIVQEKLEIIHCSDKFPLLKTDDFIDGQFDNTLIVKNNRYGFKFVHDFNVDIESELSQITDKYRRRIERFYQTLVNPNIKVVFIRIGCSQLSHKDLEYFNSVIRNYTTNYEFKYIKYHRKTKFQSWKREELNWETYLL